MVGMANGFPVINPTDPCPCGERAHVGVGEQYALCCGRYLAGEQAPTAELLMRSRYTAYAVGDAPYLLRTWHESTRPPKLELDPAQQWVRLEVLDSTGGSLFDSDATVRFRAHYAEGGGQGVMEENSTFVRVDGQWLYVDAT